MNKKLHKTPDLQTQVLREHFKGIVWPRAAVEAKTRANKRTTTCKVYRYIVVGVLVTDAPIADFVGKNEVVLDGPVTGLVERVVTMKQREPRIRTGDATSVLLNLEAL